MASNPHLYILVQLAQIDGETDETELELIRQIGKSENLTDEDYFQGGFSQSGALGAATLVKGSPRSYGLEARYNF